MPIQEPYPYNAAFNGTYFSYKFHGPALRYIVAVCIQTGDIVYVDGPFPAATAEITIFRQGLLNMLLPGEMVETDNGFLGEPNHIQRREDYVSRADRKAKKKAGARHECVNRHIKTFRILTATFRHERHKHQSVFFAIAVIAQIKFDNGEGPFQCRY